MRGDIGTGKSALLKRLRGGGFTPSYEPRHAPQAACKGPPRSETPLRGALQALTAPPLAPQRANLDGQDCVEVRVGAR